MKKKQLFSFLIGFGVVSLSFSLLYTFDIFDKDIDEEESTPKYLKDGVLKILSIGNSFSVDGLEYAYQIANDLGVENIEIGNLYIGGCCLSKHLTNAQNDSSSYTYYYNDSGTWTTTNNYKISTAVSSTNWDFITFQQCSNYSGVEDTYDDLVSLMEIVTPMCSSATFGWHMTWAYQSDSTHSAFANYDNDQQTMYNAIINSVKNKIVPNNKLKFIIPNGTAVQNARSSSLGDTLTRDGYHMSYDIGRYLTGLGYIATLTDLDITKIKYAPSGVDEITKKICITQSKYI